MEQRITVDFQDTPLKDVIALFSYQVSTVNFVVTPAVSANPIAELKLDGSTNWHMVGFETEANHLSYF